MKRAFTLVELMLVIVVLAIVAAILVPRPKVKPVAVVEVTSQEFDFSTRFSLTKSYAGTHIRDKKTGIEYLYLDKTVFELTSR